MNSMNTELSDDDVPAALTKSDFPFTNHAQCKLLATMSCTALTIMVPMALFLRTAHVKPFAFSILVPSLCLTNITLVVGVLLVFLAEYEATEYRRLNNFLYIPPFDWPHREHVCQELRKKYKTVVNCEEWGRSVLPWGLTMSVGVVVAFAVLMLF